MMESQNRKRAPAWTEREVQDLIAVWGEESVISELRSSFRNAKTFVKISQGMKDRGHNRDSKQCRVKLKELRQAYQKTREANGRSGSEPQTCRFYDELHAILGGSATTTPAVLFDSFNGDGGNTEAGFGDEEDDDEVVDSSQQASGEAGFPNSQELFLTLYMEPVPPEPTQGCLPDPPGGEGTSGQCFPNLGRRLFRESPSGPGRFGHLLRLQVRPITTPTGRGSLLQADGGCGKRRPQIAFAKSVKGTADESHVLLMSSDLFTQPWRLSVLKILQCGLFKFALPTALLIHTP
ncbi:Zinc finger and SCAN domain-containing protein 29 [Chelonia mydas]|uniref:Zinc finger and SCAN domain-containing protein 29 n=1 Tax=Chelonia mydas TaxID=8469 RepID=M7CG32_CHEMY|nr:Zinc finger and SCAN domain-containing protein 29 [Chelonia mydas]